jgi:HlyD family secretion protein
MKAIQPVPWIARNWLTASDEAKDATGPGESVAGPIRMGFALMLGFFGVFLGWGYFVPLASGAMAPGIINPDGSKRAVQHWEGGIVAQLLVRDGDVVSAGQTLAVLESVQERTTHESLQEQHWTLWAKQVRLDAERDDLVAIDWPAELRSLEPRLLSIIRAQAQLFEARRASRVIRKNVLQQKIEQLTEQINGMDAQIQSASQQIGFVDEELQAKSMLVEKGLVAKPEALRLRRLEAEINGRRGELTAQAAAARQQIGEAQMRLIGDDADRTDQIANEWEKVHSELMLIQEKLRASEDVLRRTVITAPVSGSVINLKVRTIGGVVQKGDVFLEIVPSDDALVIDARVTPLDVKWVHKGLPATIRLSAYSSRDTPRVSGFVESVSADRLFDANSKEPYYLARVSVDRQMLRRVAPKVNLIPGMPADVLISTEQRTLIDYLFKPFLEALSKSFHEA